MTRINTFIGGISLTMMAVHLHLQTDIKKIVGLVFLFSNLQEIPQQMNGSDCGMFTCKYAEYITKDKPITFTQVGLPSQASEVCRRITPLFFFCFKT